MPIGTRNRQGGGEERELDTITISTKLTAIREGLMNILRVLSVYIAILETILRPINDFLGAIHGSYKACVGLQEGKEKTVFPI